MITLSYFWNNSRVTKSFLRSGSINRLWVGSFWSRLWNSFHKRGVCILRIQISTVQKPKRCVWPVLEVTDTGSAAFTYVLNYILVCNNTHCLCNNMSHYFCYYLYQKMNGTGTYSDKMFCIYLLYILKVLIYIYHKGARISKQHTAIILVTSVVRYN